MSQKGTSFTFVFDEKTGDSRVYQGTYIYFVRMPDKPKTEVWQVKAEKDDIELGRIKWFPHWRGYAFFPQSDMVFEKTCLREISNLIEILDERHRSK